MASCDRSYEHSWHPVTERTSNRGTRRPMVRSIVGCNDRSPINRTIVRLIVRLIVATYDRSHDQWWHQTIWNRRLKVLNKTIDLATTDLVLAITTTSATSRTFVLRFANDSNIFRSQVGRNLVISPVWVGLNGMNKKTFRK